MQLNHLSTYIFQRPKPRNSFLNVLPWFSIKLYACINKYNTTYVIFARIIKLNYITHSLMQFIYICRDRDILGPMGPWLEL